MKIRIENATTLLKEGVLEIEAHSFTVSTEKDEFEFAVLGSGKLRVAPAVGTGIAVASHGAHSLTLEVTA